jgi:predicted nucleic acid-binding protein
VERGKPYTNPSGPVVISEKTLRALIAIRKEKLLPELFGRVAIARSNFDALAGSFPAGAPDWLRVMDDRPDQALPERIAMASPSEAATLRLAIATPASLVLIDGPIKDRAKLTYIKAMSTVPILVLAYQRGKLSAVRPMVKALQSLGHADVLPPPDQIEALWKALEGPDAIA